MVIAAILFVSPWPMAVAATLLAATVAVGVRRRVRAGRLATAMVLAGGACWAMAAGSPVWQRPAARMVAVMVDLSPSTRGASFRNRAELDRRVAQLLGDTPHQLFAFAGGNPQPLPESAALADLPCDRTVFAPPSSADAVVLFSDGRFDPPALLPPTFAVIDPSLERPGDAAVTRLEWSGDRVTATVVADRPATLRWTGADPPTADVSGGGVAWATPTGDEVTATVRGGDRWPENDALSIRRPPPPTAERWWVGTSPAPAGWRAIAPSQLPTDPAAYLSAGTIVLDDVPADDLTGEQQRQLAGYVRDLGGGLMIGGGPHAFAAGGYGRTPIDAVSPLASDPPGPSRRWVVLIDGSGSMAAGDAPGPTPWQVECDAAARVLPLLPGADPVRIGSFADGVRWWADDAPAADARAAPPAGVAPHGPTNLAPALRQVAVGSSTPTQLLLMTDADADLPDAAEITEIMKSHHVALHLLATGNGSALGALRAMAAATGGSVVQQADPGHWVAAARRLARAAVPRQFVDHPTPVSWTGATGPATAAAWNRTWLRPTADALARGPDAPLAARWRAGAGEVVAVAFAADPALLAALAERVATEPREPRFAITWEAGPALRVSVDAVDAGRYLNGVAMTVQLDDAAPRVVEQTGPGSYAASLQTPTRPAIATVRAAGRVIGRFAVAGRYPAEFDAVGTDRAALQRLAERSGGRVVEPTETAALTFPGPPRRTPLTSPLAAGGAVAVAAGLVRWRQRRR
jgi:hypothetical protein